jgi:hypothetical protein
MQKLDGFRVNEVYRAFERDLYFHGTSKESAEDIKTHGMRLSRKKEGSSSCFKRRFGMEDPASATHHYVMTFSKACGYAKMFDDPQILRMILPKSRFTLEQDPEASPDGEEFRTSLDIPKDYILCNAGKGLRRRLKSIVEEMGFAKLKKKELRELKERVCKNFMGTQASDRKAISDAYSYVRGEEERIASDFKKMRSLGVDPATLKPGDIITLPVDEEEF